MIENAVQKLIDFIRKDPVILNSRKLGFGKVILITQMENVLLVALDINEKTIEKKKQQEIKLKNQKLLERHNKQDVMQEDIEQIENTEVTNVIQKEINVFLQDLEDSDFDDINIDLDQMEKRRKQRGNDLQKVNSQIFHFNNELKVIDKINKQKTLDENMCPKLIFPSEDRKLKVLNLFNVSEEHILMRILSNDPRLKKLNIQEKIDFIPLNKSGIYDIFMVNDELSLNIWQQEELIMDQILENLHPDFSDANSYKENYNKEVKRQSQVFYTRKEVEIAGQTAQDVLDKIQNRKQSVQKSEDLNAEQTIMQEQQHKFYEFIKSNSWISVISVLRSNRNFGMGGDMLHKNGVESLSSFQKHRLEQKNGIDLLNCLDEKGRSPLQLAFKYKARDVAGVLLHLGADHVTNSIQRQFISNYIRNALKQNFYGLDNFNDNLPTLAYNQVLALTQSIYPKFDSIVYDLLNHLKHKTPILLAQRKKDYTQKAKDMLQLLSKNKQKNENINQEIIIKKKNNSKSNENKFNKIEQSFVTDILKKHKLQLNEFTFIRDYVNLLIERDKLQDYENILQKWKNLYNN